VVSPQTHLRCFGSLLLFWLFDPAIKVAAIEIATIEIMSLRLIVNVEV